MSINNRVAGLEKYVLGVDSPAGKPAPKKILITLSAEKELGRPPFSNFTREEIEPVKQKYIAQYKGQNVELMFFVRKYVCAGGEL